MAISIFSSVRRLSCQAWNTGSITGAAALGMMLCPLLPARGQDTGTDPAVALRLSELDGQLNAALERDVVPGYHTAVADLNTKYLAALEQAFSAAKTGGKLEEALALQTEKERVTSAQPLPANDTGLEGTSLGKLRTGYRAALTRLDTDRERRSMPYLQKYRTVLTAYQAELTRAGNIHGAVAVAARLESTAGGSLTANAQVTVSSAAMAPLTTGGTVYGDRDFTWAPLPKIFIGAQYSRSVVWQNPVLKLKVKSSGLVYMACTTRWLDSGNGTDWHAECLDKAKLEAAGWKHQPDLKLDDSNPAYTWLVFTKACKQNEEISLRTEKYISPIVINLAR